jgi:tetratricopeptide (TPR) repeat protein
MLASAEATLRSVVELIRHAPPGPHRRSLFAVAAELARVAGWCAYDEMVNDEAQLYYLAALRAAHTADDWVLVVDILGNLSTMMFFSGHFQDAMYLLGISDQEERRTLLPPALTALICARRARYYAVIQHAPQLRDAAVEALGLLSAPRPDPAAADTSPWASRLSIAEVHGMLGEAWLMLGRPQEAEPLLRSALELYPGDSLRDRANTMVRLGRCLMELGYSEDARTVVNDARTLIASGVRSARLNKNVDTYDRLYPGPTGPSQ